MLPVNRVEVPAIECGDLMIGGDGNFSPGKVAAIVSGEKMIGGDGDFATAEEVVVLPTTEYLFGCRGLMQMEGINSILLSAARNVERGTFVIRLAAFFANPSTLTSLIAFSRAALPSLLM